METSTCSRETPGDAGLRPGGLAVERRFVSEWQTTPGVRAPLLRRVCWAVLFAAALGYIEAGVVVYLREILVPFRRSHFPEAAREPLPLLRPEVLAEAGREYERLLAVEVAREVMPILALLAMAWALRRRRGELAAFFVLGFGLWDIFYYVFLKVLLDWPASLGTWDVLYLIPTAWVAPVWAPLVVSTTMAAAGMAFLFRRRGARRAPGSIFAWGLVAVGVALVIASFLLRTGEAFGGVPQRFDWAWFAAGWLAAVTALAWLLRPV